MTIIIYESETVKKTSGVHTSEKKYVCMCPPPAVAKNTPKLGSLIRNHLVEESIHWRWISICCKTGLKRKSYKLPQS